MKNVRVFMSAYTYPGFRKYIPITLTGKWKTRVTNNVPEIYVEVERIVWKVKWFSQKRVTELWWVNGDDIYIEEVEEFINECGNTNG